MATIAPAAMSSATFGCLLRLAVVNLDTRPCPGLYLLGVNDPRFAIAVPFATQVLFDPIFDGVGVTTHFVSV